MLEWGQCSSSDGSEELSVAGDADRYGPSFSEAFDRIDRLMFFLLDRSVDGTMQGKIRVWLCVYMTLYYHPWRRFTSTPGHAHVYVPFSRLQ